VYIGGVPEVLRVTAVRQRDRDAQPALGARGEPQTSGVGVDDGLGDREPEPEAFPVVGLSALATVEGLQELPRLLRCDDLAGVLDLQFGLLTALSSWAGASWAGASKTLPCKETHAVLRTWRRSSHKNASRSASVDGIRAGGR
jgi:hypothetical protein